MKTRKQINDDVEYFRHNPTIVDSRYSLIIIELLLDIRDLLNTNKRKKQNGKRIN